MTSAAVAGISLIQKVYGWECSVSCQGFGDQGAFKSHDWLLARVVAQRSAVAGCLGLVQDTARLRLQFVNVLSFIHRVEHAHSCLRYLRHRAISLVTVFGSFFLKAQQEAEAAEEKTGREKRPVAPKNAQLLRSQSEDRFASQSAGDQSLRFSACSYSKSRV